MIFKKPANVKYTDMCIFIDEKIQQESISDEDASLVFEYLYHLIYMLSVKQHFFHKEEYYDEFAIITAGDVYHRLFTNPKLKQFNEDGTPKMTQIKSCLNYIKSILHGRKVNFEQSNYSQKFIDIEQADANFKPISTTFAPTWKDLDFTPSVHVDFYLESIADTIKEYLYHTSPYRNDKLLMKNIYLSCVISILNALTFTALTLNNIQSKYVTTEAKSKYLDRVYAYNKSQCITLYHLNDTYKNYITFLVRQLFTIMGKDIREMSTSYINLPEDVLMSIALSEVLGKYDVD